MAAQGAVAERMPCAFVTHGGGPMPVIAPGKQGGLSQSLGELGEKVRKLKPKALLVVSAHWEESKVSIIPDEQPELLFDYYGFPPESYKLKYPAPGHPELARSVSQLLTSKGIPTETVSGRGWDHGVFIPLMLMLSKADIPVLQVSLLKSLDPTAHLKLGEALSSLRDEGVFILASGSSFHNMGGFFGRGDYRGASKAFHAWLKDTLCTSTPEKRWAALEAWQSAPHALDCHPREEHLIPLHVAVGAAGSDAGQLVYSGDMMNMEVASYWFGRMP